MDRKKWYLAVAAILVALSAVLYTLHFFIFHDAHHIYIYLLGDLAFLPLEVLLVSLIIDLLLSERDKRAVLEKMNMVIGAFYGEMGTGLLRFFMECDPGREKKRELFEFPGDVKGIELEHLEVVMASMEFEAEARDCDLPSLKELLLFRRDFMVRLLENPMLLEHQAFTDILWAVFHLTEELDARSELSGLPASDISHLAGDMTRAYGLLARGWLSYMRHLEANYPYLFSLAVRLNPFREETVATVA